MLPLQLRLHRERDNNRGPPLTSALQVESFRLVEDEYGSRHAQCVQCGCLVCCGARCACPRDQEYGPLIAQQLFPPQPVIQAWGE